MPTNITTAHAIQTVLRAPFVTRGGRKSLVSTAACAYGALLGLILTPLLPPISTAAAATSTAGSTMGSFDVSDLGAATYSIPIAVPPGVRGVQPSLALSYNSQNKDNGLLGIGWGLAGLSTIHRCGATIHIDGYKGGVNYDANDKLCLDGARLIAIGNNEYRTEHESWQRVYASGGGTNPSYFTVYAPDGGTRIYGGTGDSRIEAKGQAQGTGIARVWALNRVQDKRNNALTVTYTEDNANGDYRPAEIVYAGAALKVQFGYCAANGDCTRPDQSPRYEGGAIQRTMSRLYTITTYADGAYARQYRLTYDPDGAVGRTRLKTVQECGFDGTTPACLAPTTFTWQTAVPGYAVSTTWAGHGISDSGPHFADLNGDGKMDYTTSDGVGTLAGTHYVSLSTGSGYTNTTWPGYGIADGTVNYADLNGDGLEDYVAVSTAGQHYVSLSTGSGYSSTTWLSYGYDASTTLATQFADMNGDGLSDHVIASVDGNHYVSLSMGKAYLYQTWSGHGISGFSISTQFVDLNGDGKIDSTTSEGTGTHYVSLSTGSGYINPVWSGQAYGTSIGGAHYVDLNGDGKQDYITISHFGSHYPSLSTGTGYVNATWSGHGISNSGTQFADINGDGLKDYVTVSSDGTHFFSLSTGAGYVNRTAPGHGISDSGAHFADLNGDGCDDYVTVSAGGTHYVSLANCKPDLITTVTNGFGAQTVITYKPLTDSSVYTKVYSSVLYPEKTVQDATYVVSSHQQSNGIGGMNTWSYYYGGLKYDYRAARSLGFYYTRTTGPDGILQNTVFYQTPELAGQIYYTTTYVSGSLRKHETFTRDSVALGGGRILPRLTQTTSSGSDLNNASLGSATTIYSNFDSYGFPQTVTATTSDNYNKTTTSTYNHDTVNWLLGQVVQTSVTATAPGQNAQTRTSSFTYVPTTGELQTETIEPNSTDPTIKLTATYTYDVFGNKYTTAVTGWDGSATTTRTTTTAYDATGRFVVRTTNALGHSAYVDNYDTRFGAPTYERDVNGIAMSAAYDGLGRKVSETQFANTSTPLTASINYFTWPTWYGGTGMQVQTVPQGGAVTNMYHNILGRPLQTHTQGLYSIGMLKTTFYDTLGRPIYEATHLSTEPPRYTAYAYDALSRPISITPPLDAKGQSCPKTMSYSGLTTTVTHCPNRSTGQAVFLTTIKNTQGAILSTTDNAGTVSNTYDAFGNLVSVRDPVGNTSNMGYDLRGRKTAMNDPDMGVWTYTHNAYGELRTQRDAKGQTHSMTYDALGRLKTRTTLEGTSTWTYDTGTKGIGKLASVIGLGVTESYTYDTLSRPVSTLTNINGASYTTTVSYDVNSRPLTRTYPTGFRTRNVYDPQGHLCELWSDSLSATPAPATCGTTPPVSGNTRYWKADAQEAWGALKKETYGNGTTTDYTYDPASQDLSAITTKNAANTVLRNLTLDFDAPGNLMSRSWWDGTATRTETFTYDALNRLTQVAGPAPKSISYNTIGNILSKSDVGTYSYPAPGSARPHAVASIIGTVNTSFTYDANGNQLTGNGKTLTWTSFNKVKTATQGATTVTVTYGPNFERRTKTIPQGTRHYLNGHERDITGTLVTDRHYLHVGNQLIAVRQSTPTTATTTYYHADHLGSVDTAVSDTGTLIARYSFDPWGKPRNPNGTDNPNATTGAEGYTKHQHDLDVGLIHMHARQYDPQLGRFISSDPLLDNGLPSQVLNRYTYVQNKPLSMIDPSGHLSKKWNKRLQRITKALVMTPEAYVADRYTWKAIVRNPKAAPYVRAAAQAVVGFYTGGDASAIAGTGAVFDARFAKESGVELDDALRAGGRGFVTSYALSYVGNTFNSPGSGLATKSLPQSIGNSLAQTAVAQYAESKGINPIAFNLGLFALSHVGNALTKSRYDLTGARYGEGPNHIVGILNRGILGAPFDAVDILLAAQGFQTASALDYRSSGGRSEYLLSGHSLGALDVANLVGQGYAPDGVGIALPFGKVGGGIAIFNGWLDIVSGGPIGVFANLVLNPGAQYPCACPGHFVGY